MALGKISKMIQSSNIDVNLIEEVLDGLRDVFQQWVGFIIYLLIVSPQRSLIFARNCRNDRQNDKYDNFSNFNLSI